MSHGRALPLLLGVAIIGLLPSEATFPGNARLRSASTPPRGLALSTDATPEKYANLPLGFEPNFGQAGPAATFLVSSGDATILLSPLGLQLLVGRTRPSDAASAHAPAGPTVHTMNLVGARPAQMTGQSQLRGHSNYFIGQDPSDWITGIPRFAAVRYHHVYPGVDLIVSGRGGDVEYDFAVSKEANPDAIQLSFPEAEHLSIDPDGGLVVRTGESRWAHRRPFAYQRVAGRVVPVRAWFRIDGRSRVHFGLGRYDPSLPLVIDPVLSYSTYLGGTDLDSGYGVAVDAAGSAYVVGRAVSSDFPIKGGLPVQKGMAFVSKLTPGGADLEYSTYLGGDLYDSPSWLNEMALAVSVDGAGNAYVVGQTQALDFPVVNAIQDGPQGEGDAFVSKLDASGSSLVYSTYLGGEREDWATAVTVDDAGSAFVTGYTASYLFPLKDPLPMKTTADDAFVSKLHPSGSSFVYSTRFGGYTPFLDAGSEAGQGIAVDSDGSVVFAGWTESSVFPLVEPLQPAFGGGEFDGFIAKLSPGGDAIVYSTFFGGSGPDEIQALAIDDSGAAYVTGWTESADFPTRGPIEACLRSGDSLAVPADAVVAKVSSTGSLEYSTYLGGDSLDYGRGITVDDAGIAYVVGDTTSFDFPSGHPIQKRKGQAEDAFVSAVGPSGSRLLFSSFLGGGSTQNFYVESPGDHARAVTRDGTGSLYVAGDTISPDFPIRHPFQGSLAGGYDGFIAKISSPTASPSGYHKGCVAPVGLEPFQNRDVGSWPEGVAIGDVTGDGRNDALLTTSHYTGERGDHKLFVFPQLVDGSLGRPTAYDTDDRSDLSQYGVSVGDLNGDGLMDAAVAIAPGIDMYFQEAGRLIGPVLIPLPGEPQHLEIEDVTGDGLDDILVASSESVVLLKNVGGTFEATSVVDAPQVEAEVGELTGDGLIDVVGITGPRSVHVFAQNPDGTFGPPQDYEVLDDGSEGPAGLEVADVTGDGRDDVIVSLGGNVPRALINVFPQRPGGTLGRPRAYHTRDIPQPVEAADLTGDDRADVVSANGGWFTISVNVQEPDGALAPYQRYEVADQFSAPSLYEPKGLALGDLNGDGGADVALADYINGLVVLYQRS